MKSDPSFRRIALALLLAALAAPTAAAGGKKMCGRCGKHEDVKSVYRLVKVHREIDMPQYAHTKQETFFPDKGAVAYHGYRCDTYLTLWKNCDCTVGCQAHTVCGCQTHYGAKATGCHSGCTVRQPYAVERLDAPVLKWEVVKRCKDCCENRRRKK